MASKSITLAERNVNAVNRLRFTLRKDGVAWAGIDSATLVFEKPDRETQFEQELVVENNLNGIWYYDTVSGDFDTPGYWTLSVRVTQGSIIVRYPYDIGTRVRDNP